MAVRGGPGLFQPQAWGRFPRGGEKPWGPGNCAERLGRGAFQPKYFSDHRPDAPVRAWMGWRCWMWWPKKA